MHWGFDSNNWRHYILIPEESDIGMEAVLKCQPLLEELKSKFNAILGDASKAAATSAFSAAQMAKRETKALSVSTGFLALKAANCRRLLKKVLSLNIFGDRMMSRQKLHFKW